MRDIKIICKDCGEREATHINEPDPYAEDICGDNTPTDLCEECYHESCMAI